MFRVWARFSRQAVAVRQPGGESVRLYHTRNCFGHRLKHSPRVDIKEDWVTTRAAYPNLWRLVCAYREHGHKVANLDPLELRERPHLPELDPASYGLANQLDSIFPTEGIIHGFPSPQAPLSSILLFLQQVYCGHLAIESSHVKNVEEREWLAQCFETSWNSSLSQDRQKSIVSHLLKSQAFDIFLAKKFGTLKRYGAEGAENMLTFFVEAFRKASLDGVTDVILGMPHRGRLNLLTGLLKFSPTALFHKVKGNPEFHEDISNFTGDVPSHLVSSVSLDVEGSPNGPLYVTLLPNPSHLEAVNPVVMGKARGRLLSLREGPYSHAGGEDARKSRVLSLQIHGDAAFCSQGIVMESLGLADLPHFSVDGSVHLIVNNQLGFTTEEEHGRSMHYCSDVAKMIDSPIIHVNGDHPEDVVRATSIAMDYWKHFHSDIVLDMVCFRRWGHNELDNPTLTQPLMYNVINTRATVPDLYAQKLETQGITTSSELSQITETYTSQLNQCLQDSNTYSPENQTLRDRWGGMQFAPNHITSWDTGCTVDLLKYVGVKSVNFPEEEYKVNDRLERSHINDRVRTMQEGVGVNWATAEALAFGTLLYQGFHIRLCGQDVGRGTFSHRHAMLVCQESDNAYIPLNHMIPEQSGCLEVVNSPLSEEAVLGFEYGFSIENPRHLTVWEAQFGDFFNGAQIIIDTFISSGETKWFLQSGMVMLLPHGYDGAGPEHSSCRLERFLQMTDSIEAGSDGDSVNMHVVYPTTPAQYFHLLRQQMVQNFRKPLIVASPKILLRLPVATSSLAEMAPGTTFQPVLGDSGVDPRDVSRIVFCSGKHYYQLDSHRKETGVKNTAIVRVEMLSPFPSGYLHQELKKYPNAREFIWSQEEPQNMGAWHFVEPRFRNQLGCHLSYAGRKQYPCPATGVSLIHNTEAQKLLVDTFPQTQSTL